MNKRLLTAMLALSGAVLFGQEITAIKGAQKNGQGVYISRNPAAMFGYFQFSEVLNPGYYSLTCKVADKFPTLFWTQRGAAGGYTACRPAETPRSFLYYFKVTDGSKLAFLLKANAPKGNKTPVGFAAKDFNLTALKEIPGDMFPDFQNALKDTPDEKNFIYCFDDRKSTVITKTMKDKVPVISIEGNAEKQYQSIGCTVPFPAVNGGRLTVKFTAKSGGGSKQMLVLVRDSFWKKGGDRRNFTLTNDWAEYTFEIDCAKKFQDGIVLAVADCRFGQGVYLFKDFSVTYAK